MKALTVLLSLGAVSGQAVAAELSDAIAQGKVSVQLRPRFEWVDQAGFAQAAEAPTLRTQLGYTTASFAGYNAMLQFEDVRNLGGEQFNSTINGRTQYPVVADPEATEVNQAWLRYAGMSWVEAKFGRQVLTYDNHRFIGDVGWRQNQQTYDGVSAVIKPLGPLAIQYAHLTNANRVFSERHPALSDYRMASDLLNVAYKAPFGTAVGYGYFLEFTALPAISHSDLGARFDGGARIGSVKLLYTAEYAEQADYADAPATVDADYLFGSAGVEVAGVQLRANYERLSGSGVYAFQTPLATLHAVNGWADKFLITPADGLQDTFLSLGAAMAGFNFAARYHLFSSDHLGYDYGSEFDAMVARKLAPSLTVMVKYADYAGDANATVLARNPALVVDVRKAWLQADYQF